MNTHMQTGRIILPILRNDGKTPLAETHKRLATLLLAAFGGVTVVFGTGMYDNPGHGVQTEEIYQYTVAYAPSHANETALRAIAKTVGAEAGQDTVYVEYAGGAVELVSTSSHSVPVYEPHPMQAINDNYPGVIPMEAAE